MAAPSRAAEAGASAPQQRQRPAGCRGSDGAEPAGPARRLALVLANGAYVHRAPLSKPVAAAAELQRKLLAMGFEVVWAENESLDGMRTATSRWLERVEGAARAAEEEAELELFSSGGGPGASKASSRNFAGKLPPERASAGPAPLLIFFAFCGHGASGRFYPVDCPRGRDPEGAYCFFKDFLGRLYDALSWYRADDAYEGPLLGRLGSPVGFGCGADGRAAAERQWRLPGCARVVALIESCRRLGPEEQEAYDVARARVASGKRHMLPSLAAQLPDLAPVGGAEWDAARLAGLADLGPGSPQLLLALSSESTTPSYDAVFLRSVTEAIDKPVKLKGIFERACLDTLRRTGHRQKPVLLALGGGPGSDDGGPSTQDLVLAQGFAPPRPQSRGAPSPPAAASRLPGCRRHVKRMSLPALRAS